MNAKASKPMRYLLGLLLMVAYVDVQSQPPSPSPAISGQYEKNEPATSHQETTNQQRNAESSPIVAKVSPAEVTDDYAKQEVAKRNIQATNERWLIGANVISVIFTGILAVYTIRLWRSTHRMVEVAEDTAIKQLRAYVALEEAYPRTKHAHEDRDALKVRVKNYGATPAHDMTIWLKSVELEPPESGFNPTYIATDKISEPQTLHPAQQFSQIAIRNYVFTGEVNKSRGDDMGENYIFGRIVYRDIFDNWWGTCFCYEYEGGALFRPHGDYNKEENYGKQRPV